MHKTLSEPKSGEHCIILSSGNLSMEQWPSAERSPELETSLENTRLTVGYQASYFKETFSDELWQAMEHRGLNQADFAQKAGVPKQFLTKVFRGGNCTMETIVKLAHALNYRAHIHLTPNDVGCEWMHRVLYPVRLNTIGILGLWDEGYQNVKSLEKEVECGPITSNS